MKRYVAVLLSTMFGGCSRECYRVIEVLKCGANECRVVIDDGRRITVENIVVPSDIVSLWSNGRGSTYTNHCK